MTFDQIVIATLASVALISITYAHSGWQKIKDCYHMWFTKEYWTNYNIVEFASWVAKAVIIIPGLIFGIQLWWL